MSDLWLIWTCAAGKCPPAGHPGVCDCLVDLGNDLWSKRSRLRQEVVPLGVHRGAVEALERIRDHAASGDDPALIAQRALDSIRGQ